MLASAFWLAFFGRSGVRALLARRSRFLSCCFLSARTLTAEARDRLVLGKAVPPSSFTPGADLRNQRDGSPDRY